MNFPYHVQGMRRVELGRRWGKRSAVARQRIRDEVGPDAETVRMRGLHDAKGTVEREGTTYRSTGITHWQVRRAIWGSVDQFEFVANGHVKLCAGRRRFPVCFRPHA